MYTHTYIVDIYIYIYLLEAILRTMQWKGSNICHLKYKYIKQKIRITKMSWSAKTTDQLFQYSQFSVKS